MLLQVREEEGSLPLCAGCALCFCFLLQCTGHFVSEICNMLSGWPEGIVRKDWNMPMNARDLILLKKRNLCPYRWGFRLWQGCYVELQRLVLPPALLFLIVTAWYFLLLVNVKHLWLAPSPHSENNAAVNALNHVLKLTLYFTGNSLFHLQNAALHCRDFK